MEKEKEKNIDPIKFLKSRFSLSALAVVPLLILILSACSSNKADQCTKDIFAMDTYMTLTAYGEDCKKAVSECEEEIIRLDDLLSTGKETSEISILNKNGTNTLSNDSIKMINEAVELYKKTDGAFDITVYPLMKLWGFTEDEQRIPKEKEILETLDITGSDKLVIEGDILKLETGMGIDLGGIAKGYASDKVKEIMDKYEISSALISLGGNVGLFGHKPDGSLWKCGIRDPIKTEDGNALLGILEAEDCFVITSGAYERFFKGSDGRTYHHIIDPHTGYPAENGIISATIVSKNGMLADALSTACYVMGKDKAIEFWKENKNDFDMILMTNDEEVYVTESIAEHFSSEYDIYILTP